MTALTGTTSADRQRASAQADVLFKLLAQPMQEIKQRKEELRRAEASSNKKNGTE